MQTRKKDIQTRILETAEELFLRKGFQKTSMREIADAAGVGLGNIYNYFPGKDEIFRATVYPATRALEAMLQEHHGRQGENVMLMQTETYLQTVTTEYVNLLRTRWNALELLFFRAQGSTLENYREQFTDRSTVLVKEWLANMKRLYPSINISVSDFSIHLHTVWMFTLFEEIIMHKIKPKDTSQIITEYIRFETIGWRELIKI